MRIRFSRLVLSFGIALQSSQAQRPRDRASFITTLGRDTVAIESYERSASRLVGDFVLRVPTTVLFHYQIDSRPDGRLVKSRVEMKPLRNDRARWVVDIEYRGDSARIVFDSAGTKTLVTRAAPGNVVPSLTTGFGSSFGIYTSIGMLQADVDCLTSTDSSGLPAMGALSGRVSPRLFRRRSSTMVDVDYFRIAWIHLTLDEQGLIQRVDASETTEKTMASRVASADVAAAARDFAARDAAGRGIGVASPPDSARAIVGRGQVSVMYSSPRLRSRKILGETVPYDRVWRTGANAATVLKTERELLIGGTRIPAGSYSLWTLPTRESVTLIINRQHGQWGTEYDPSRDLARVALRTGRANSTRENLSITLPSVGADGELQIAWDDFIWSVAVRAP